MKKKQKKTKEESAAETFFRVGKETKHTTEKEERPDLFEAKTITEKPYRGKVENPIEEMKKTRPIRSRIPRKKDFKKIPNFKKTVKGKNKKSFSKAVKFAPPEISLKKGGYELVITEKPQAALKISYALGESSKNNLKGIPYYEVNRKGKRIVVACAVGHLFTLMQNSPGSSFPTFDISWIPNYLAKKADFTKKYYDAIINLSKNAGSITVATDYDIEGEVIGLNIVRYICGQKDASRMKFSTLTAHELNKAYENKSPSLNWGQAIAGETRHYLDWFYGINLSRALMSAIKTTGRFKIMSIGRVQGPALNLIVQKEREIQAFKSVPYWQVFITVKNSHVIELKYIKDIFNKKELEKFKDIKGKTGTALTEKKSESLPPQPPFNLTTLQTEAYRLYGINPSRTLQIAQSLYLSGLISYPRTSSQKLPISIGYKEILEKLASRYNFEHLVKRQTPVEGSKTDPAHPSIYPTGEYQILSGDEEKMYSLIAKRFLALFCEDAIIDKKRISVTLDSLKFTATGSAIRKKSWLEIYPSIQKEKEIPDIEGQVKIINTKIEEKETQPPRRYSPASIISELEKRNLGTKATRSNILDTLYDRGYIKGQSVEASPLGISLIETLEKYSPIIIDEALTRNFEDSMEDIIEAKEKNSLQNKEEKIIEKAKEAITKISKDFEVHKNEIGKELMNAETELRKIEREENKIIQCPKCQEGELAVMYSKKNRRQFIACNAYPKCSNTYSLPPNSLIKKAGKTCEKCSFPMLMALRKGKRPWFFCFNKECETNKERLEEYNKRKQQEENKLSE
ncbi:MAG: DNA topoisomerase I [Nanoarchaeota archaeon]